MSARKSSAFNARTVFGLILFGAVAFISMLYLIGAGDTGRRGNDGRAHAASNGLNGFSGLAQILEKKGYNVRKSRSLGGLDTYGLLIVTPPSYMEAEELSDLLKKREDYGPTIVILPKWYAQKLPEKLPARVREKLDRDIGEGWVKLRDLDTPEWPEDLPAPYGFKVETEELEKGQSRGWESLDHRGEVPTSTMQFAELGEVHEALVTDDAGHPLAFTVVGEEGSDYYDNASWTLFVADPDLLNNYGLARQENAALAEELVDYVRHEEMTDITFDLTLNGFGGEANLLTLAFTPPFLAATLCLILALAVIAWRAFLRFGPPIAEGPAIAFGKKRLIANGAGLILRGKRFGLLTASYAAIVRRRLAASLGLPRANDEAIDAAIGRRLPQSEPFSPRAATLRAARKPHEILRAARALHELEKELKR